MPNGDQAPLSRQDRVARHRRIAAARAILTERERTLTQAGGREFERARAAFGEPRAPLPALPVPTERLQIAPEAIVQRPSAPPVPAGLRERRFAAAPREAPELLGPPSPEEEAAARVRVAEIAEARARERRFGPLDPAYRTARRIAGAALARVPGGGPGGPADVGRRLVAGTEEEEAQAAELAATRGMAENLARGLPSFVAEFEAAAALPLVGSVIRAGGGAGVPAAVTRRGIAGLARPRALTALGRAAVREAGVEARRFGTFEATRTALEQRSPEEIAQAALTGAGFGAPFGVIPPIAALGRAGRVSVHRAARRLARPSLYQRTRELGPAPVPFGEPERIRAAPVARPPREITLARPTFERRMTEAERAEFAAAGAERRLPERLRLRRAEPAVEPSVEAAAPPAAEVPPVRPPRPRVPRRAPRVPRAPTVRPPEVAAQAAAGAEAFARGAPRRVPVELAVRPEQAEAWYSGWDRANLAAPVPAEVRPPAAPPAEAPRPGVIERVTARDGEEFRLEYRGPEIDPTSGRQLAGPGYAVTFVERGGQEGGRRGIATEAEAREVLQGFVARRGGARLPEAAAARPELPPRRPDTMVEAAALGAPTAGRMSRAARKRAHERLRVELFGPAGLPEPTVPQPSEAVVLRRRAAALRELAERGQKPRLYRREAERLEAQARGEPLPVARRRPAAPAIPETAEELHNEVLRAFGAYQRALETEEGASLRATIGNARSSLARFRERGVPADDAVFRDLERLTERAETRLGAPAARVRRPRAPRAEREALAAAAQGRPPAAPPPVEAVPGAPARNPKYRKFDDAALETRWVELTDRMSRLSAQAGEVAQFARQLPEGGVITGQAVSGRAGRAMGAIKVAGRLADEIDLEFQARGIDLNAVVERYMRQGGSISEQTFAYQPRLVRQQLDLFARRPGLGRPTELELREAEEAEIVRQIKGAPRPAVRRPRAAPPEAVTGRLWIMRENRAGQRWVDIRDQRIALGTPEASGQVARLLQFARNPKVEQFHTILLREGRIVSHHAESSGEVNTSMLSDRFYSSLERRAKKLGADTVILGHNHPSGIALRSDDDIRVTHAIIQHLRARAVRRGETPLRVDRHIIIDDREFSQLVPVERFEDLPEAQRIGPGLKPQYGGRVPIEAQFMIRTDRLPMPEVPESVLNLVRPDLPVIATPDVAATLLRRAVSEQGSPIQVMYLDSSARPLGLEPHHASAFETMPTWVRERTRGLGARFVIIGTNDRELYESMVEMLRKAHAPYIGRRPLPVWDVIYTPAGEQGSALNRGLIEDLRVVEERMAAKGFGVEPGRMVFERPVPPYEKAVRQRIGRAEEVAPERLSFRARRAVADLYRRVVRRTYPIERAAAQLRGEGAKLSFDDAGNVAVMASGSPVRAEEFLEGSPFRWTPEGEITRTGTPGYTAIVQGSRDVEALDAYEIAQAAIEQAAKRPKLATGVPLEAAHQVVANAPPEIRRAHEQSVAFRRDVARYWADAGGVAPETLRAWQELHEHYVPLQRIFGEGEAGTGTGRPGRVPQQIKRRVGSERRIISPVESTIDQTRRLIRAADLNRVALRLIEAAEREPEAAVGLVERVARPAGALREVEQLVAAAAARGVTLKPEVARDIVAAMSERGLGITDDVISVWRNGKREHWLLAPELGTALRSMAPQQANLWVSLLSLPARGLRTGITAAPRFPIWNLIRDSFDATLQSQYGFRLGIDSFRGFMESLRKGTRYREFRASGAGFGGEFFSAAGRGQAEALRRVTGRGAGVLMHPLQALKAFGRPFEEAARVGEFMRAREKGATVFEAGLAAKQVTTDFQQVGANMQAFSQMTAFLNPAIQSLDRMVRVTKAHPARVLALGFSSISLPTAILWAANRGDEEIAELRKGPGGLLFWYARLPNGQLVRIPKPFLWGQIFGTGMEAALDRVFDRDAEAGNRFATGLREQASSNVLPTLLQTYVGLQTNRHPMFGTPIVPEALRGVEPGLQAAPGTGETARAIGAALGFSPARLEFIFSQVTGTLGRDALKGVDAIVREVQGEGPVPPARGPVGIPVVGSFLAQYPSAGAASLRTFYDRAGKAEELVQTLRLRQNRDPASVGPWLQGRQDELAVAGLYRTSREHLGALQRQVEVVRQSRGLSADEKRQRIDVILRRQIAVARQINQAADEMRRRQGVVRRVRAAQRTRTAPRE